MATNLKFDSMLEMMNKLMLKNQQQLDQNLQTRGQQQTLVAHSQKRMSVIPKTPAPYAAAINQGLFEKQDYEQEDNEQHPVQAKKNPFLSIEDLEHLESFKLQPKKFLPRKTF